MKLYHFSNNDFDGTLKIKHAFENSYSKNVEKASPIKRINFYTVPIPMERIFDSAIFMYTCKIDKAEIYDLDKDKYLYKDGIHNVHQILVNIKRQYTGFKYSVCGYEIVSLFKDIVIDKKIKRKIGRI